MGQFGPRRTRARGDAAQLGRVRQRPPETPTSGFPIPNIRAPERRFSRAEPPGLTNTRLQGPSLVAKRSTGSGSVKQAKDSSGPILIKNRNCPDDGAKTGFLGFFSHWCNNPKSRRPKTTDASSFLFLPFMTSRCGATADGGCLFMMQAAEGIPIAGNRQRGEDSRRRGVTWSAVRGAEVRPRASAVTHLPALTPRGRGVDRTQNASIFPPLTLDGIQELRRRRLTMWKRKLRRCETRQDSPEGETRRRERGRSFTRQHSSATADGVGRRSVSIPELKKKAAQVS